MASPTVLVLSVVSGICWGLGPVFSKVGMSRGGTSRRATFVVLGVGSSIYWCALLVRNGTSRILPTITVDTVIVFAVSGVVGTSLAWLFWFWGIDRVGASVSNVVFYTQPVFATLLAVILLDERLTPGIAVGVVLIVAGVTLLSLSDDGDVDSWATSALLFPLVAAVFAAVANVINRFGFQMSAISPLEAATINLTSALPLLVGYTLLYDRHDVLSFARSDLYFVGTGLTNAAAVVSLFAALKSGVVVVVTPIVGTSPLFTVLFAHVFLGDVERVTARTVVSAVLTVAGVAAIAVL